MKYDLSTPPTTAQIANARDKAKQTMEEAAAVFGGTVQRTTWWRWENGKRSMAPHEFDYYLIKTGQKKS